MPYPHMLEYNEAIQHPNTAFVDPELRRGRVRTNALGLPLALSGGFALTYMLALPSGRRVAVRCFHKEVPAAERKYAAIAGAVANLKTAYFVKFQFQGAGIKVKGQAYPIVTMDWVDGDTLGSYLDQKATDAAAMRALRAQFQHLAAFLEQHKLAHGDIQNGNAMISGGGLRLIDYDGMHVPGLPTGNGSEYGHKHFQHPDRGPDHYGPFMDRFSFIVVDLSLQTLSEDGSLHTRFREGGETILFKANDFADPSASEIFRLLFAKPALATAARNFAAICDADITAVPTLADFLAGKNIPRPQVMVATGAAPTPPPPKPTGYIPAFPVVGATDYAAALAQVGNRVELIGRIVEVQYNPGFRGRRRGRPYCFINFGPWRGQIVKIIIWEDGLRRLPQPPDSSWVGQWISVTGLMDPPYTNARYGYVHLSVTVSDNAQIQRLDEPQARYRLASIGQTSSPRNRRLLDQLLDSFNGETRRQRPAASLGPASGPAAVRPTGSRNAAILDRIRQMQRGAAAASASPSQSPSSPGHAPHTSPPPTSWPGQPAPAGGLARVPGWVWVCVGVAILWVFAMAGRDRPMSRVPSAPPVATGQAPQAAQDRALEPERARPSASPRRRTTPAQPALTPPPAPDTPGSASTPDRVPAPSSTGRLTAAIEAEIDAYQAYVKNTVGGNWFVVPEWEARALQPLRVSFRVTRPGTIRAVQVQQRSGSAELDTSMLRAIERTKLQGLKPLPADYPFDQLEVELIFTPKR